jgi:hypothetical protein
MQLFWGTYSWAANSVKLAWHNRTTQSEAGVPLSQVLTVDVSGYLAVSSQSDCTAKVEALETALSVPYRDLRFVDDSSADTHVVLYNSTSLSGVRITAGPHFPASQGGEYVNWRYFEFTAEAEYALSGTQAQLLSFEERVTIQGGGPEYVVRKARRGPPVRQLVSEQTPYVARQSGQAVGWQAYPKAPSPIWPQWLRRSGNITHGSPKAKGPGTARHVNFLTAWEYEFEATSALIGLPTAWNP